MNELATRRAGARHRTRRPEGGWVFEHPPRLTRLLGHVAIRGISAIRKSVKNYDVRSWCLLQSIFSSGQRSGHERSPKVKFWHFQHFLQIGTNLVNQTATAPRNIAFDSSFNAFSLTCLQIWSTKGQRFGLQRAKSKKKPFLRKIFFFRNN